MNPQRKSEITEDFTRICCLDELKEHQGRRFFINDVEVALFKLNGEVYALGNVCPHQHSAVIYDGIIEDDYVVCPVHGWKFNLATGKQQTGYNGLNSYEVQIEGKEVYVKVVKKELDW